MLELFGELALEEGVFAAVVGVIYLLDRAGIKTTQVVNVEGSGGGKIVPLPLHELLNGLHEFSLRSHALELIDDISTEISVGEGSLEVFKIYIHLKFVSLYD